MNYITTSNGVPNKFGALSQVNSDSDSSVSKTSTVSNVTGTEVSEPKSHSFDQLISTIQEAIASDHCNDSKLDLVKVALQELQEVALEKDKELKKELLPEYRRRLRRAWSEFSGSKTVDLARKRAKEREEREAAEASIAEAARIAAAEQQVPAVVPVSLDARSHQELVAEATSLLAGASKSTSQKELTDKLKAYRRFKDAGPAYEQLAIDDLKKSVDSFKVSRDEPNVIVDSFAKPLPSAKPKPPGANALVSPPVAPPENKPATSTASGPSKSSKSAKTKKGPKPKTVTPVTPAPATTTAASTAAVRSVPAAPTIPSTEPTKPPPAAVKATAAATSTRVSAQSDSATPSTSKPEC